MKGTLRSKLLTNSNITNTLGTRIYPYPAPQDAAFPFITIENITEESPHNLSVAHPSYLEEEWQIDVWSTTDLQAQTIQGYLKDTLDIVGQTTFADPQKTATSAVFTIYLCHHVSSLDIMEAPDDGSQAIIYRKLSTFNLKRSKTSA